jgi:hypothetical protein
MSSLISESPLCFSAQLAQTIGLEEAIALQLLHSVAAMQTGNRFELSVEKIAQRLCFWSLPDIQRIFKSLSDKGVLTIFSPPVTQTELFVFAFESAAVQAEQPAQQVVVSQGANRISPYWQPDENTLQQLAQHGVNAEFARQQVGEFITYWRERGEISHSWQARFLKHVLREWQQQRNYPWIQKKDAQPLQAMWQPNQDALQILQRNGINARFIEDAIPEFILYWREKGTATNTWNTKFIQHVKKQWARYTSALKYDAEPRRIPANWQPSADVYDILKMANIDLAFANQCIDEFVLYWKDSNQLNSSWNTKFLQHVKYRWANQYQLLGAANAKGQPYSGQGAAATGFVEKHTDRSWAD